MNEQNITVTFNPANPGPRVTFSTDKDIKFAITSAESGRVVFHLEVATALQVVLPSSPIQWINNAEEMKPIAPPGVATVDRSGPTTVAITIQGATETTTYSFFVIVQTTDGRFFGSDPTIITMRPGDGT